MDDENAQNAPAPEPAATEQSAPELAPAEPVAPVTPEPITPATLPSTEMVSSEPTTEAEFAPAAEESPSAGVTITEAPTEPTEPQTQLPAQPPQAPISTPSTPVASQTPPAFTQSTQFRDIQAHGRSKIQEHRQNKLEKIIEVSDATATRYLVDLVKQGRLVREGSPRHAIYRFLR
jgi:hypothetical protein